ncbi:MAG: hypothetical protein J4F43_12025 [Dehalococcoidia bacterium]|nr:hypothetical protein [Dehalococcoidia bacterium]
MKLHRTLVLLVPMVLLFVLGAACGGDDPTPAPAGATAAEMQAAVEAAMAGMQPAEPMSAEEIGGLVQAAMAGMQPAEGVSAEEISSLVEAAVAAQPGATAEEIEAMVMAATEAAMSSAVTGEELAMAIDQAVSEVAAQGVSAEDLSMAIDKAVSDAVAQGVSAEDIEAMVRAAAEESGMTGEELAMTIDKAVSQAMSQAMAAAPKETIIFSDLNWTSAQVQNRIAQYIVEFGYGYPTSTVFGATLPLFNGLRAGDTHVTMEIWLPNQDEAWMEAQAMGQVVAIGESLGKDWQSAFVIPAYLQEQYPDLDSVEDLKEDQYKMLFTTAETGGKARLVSCVIGWACEAVNAAQITGYGLDDYVYVVNPGDGAAANADLYGAYEKQEAWLGYQWGTNDPPLLLDLVRLEEPAYSDECWFTTKACAYEDATILIAVAPDVLLRAPDVVAMLRNWSFDIDRYKTVAAWADANPEAKVNDAALWWLNGNADVWTGWVTDDAAAAVQTALDGNQAPEGWPTE